MRYLLHESDKPLANDYYYEATQTTNDSIPAVPPHTHNYYEIYIFLSGSVQLSVEDKIYKVRKGDIVIIPPFTIHQLIPLEVQKIYDRIYMYITKSCLNSFQFNEHSLTKHIEAATKEKHFHFHISDPNDYERIYQAMFAIYRSKKEDYFGKEMLNRSRIIEIMTLINKHIVKDMTSRKTMQINPVIHDIIAYLNEHYMEPLTLDFIEKEFFINRYTLSKLFKRHTNLTFHNYILLKRISIAKQKISEGALPSEIYYQVGFNDYSTFYRAFEKLEGISPSTFYKKIN